MGKHTNAKTKYHYIMRYLNGENKEYILNDIISNGHLSAKHRNWNRRSFNFWIDKFNEHGFEGLISRSGRPPKRESDAPEPEELSREELEWFYKKWRDKVWPGTKEEKFKEIDEELKNSSSFTKTRICQIFKVTRQGFNKWKREGTQARGKLNPEWSKIIQDVFFEKREVMGYRRIYIEIRKRGIDLFSEGTVRNYMHLLGLRSKTRVNKGRKKHTNTKHLREDLIQRDWSSTHPYEKVVTDITEFRSGGKKYFLSLTLDIFSRKIIDYEFDVFKGNNLAIPNMLRTFKIIGDCSNMIFHSDNGSEYTSYEAIKLERDFGYKASFSRPGKCQDNSIVEYTFSILKQEYLQFNYDKSFEELKVFIKWMVYDYNNVRWQGNLQNKTPQEILEVHNLQTGNFI